MGFDFKRTIENINTEFLYFDKLKTIQVNLGNICNQYCNHCHIKAGPSGNKIMSKGVMEKIINFLRIHNGLILDITGGCPELHPNLKYLVEEAYKTVSRLMIRTNLTILLERDVYWISEFYRDHEVVIIASLPCYTKENVDKQRGNGAFEKSIKALKKLNELGYGDSLELNLVYNPGGNFLPNSQMELEKDYRKHLFEKYGIKFNNLFTITNVPLGRFKNYLKSNGLIKEYIKLLVDNFNPDAVPNIMCRTLISVDWQGVLYNCDFNLSAGLPINISGKIYNIDDIQEVIQKRYEIILTEHCYACTAGSGSSCSGALVE